MSSLSSSSPDHKASQPQTKSKQERIRDNQRRSRARRQEYLAELERQLEQCRSASRDAVLQREYILDVQIENTRLRELCTLMGCNDQMVEQYISQGHARAARYSQDSNPSLRNIKPKIEPVDAGRLLHSNANSQGIMSQTGSRRPSTILSIASSLGNPDRTLASTPSSMYGPLTPVGALPISPMPQSNISGFEWMYPSGQTMSQSQVPEHEEHYFAAHPQMQAQPSMAPTFSADGFNPQTSLDTHLRGEYSIPNTITKQMVDQYNLEMENVDGMLSQGTFQPIFPSTGQTVDGQTLFQVMNKLDNYSFGHHEN